MKKIVYLSVVGVCLYVSISSAYAEDGNMGYEEPVKNTYIGIKGGKFTPNDDSGNGTSASVGGLVNFDSGLNFEASVGGRVNPYFALEGGIGGYGVKLSDAARNRLSSDATLFVIPMTVSAIVIIPIQSIDIFAGAGVGFYTSVLRTSTATSYGSYSEDYISSSLGYQLFGGMDINISPTIAIGAEYKYVNSEADFTPSSSSTPNFKMQIGGKIFNGGFKFRF